MSVFDWLRTVEVLEELASVWPLTPNPPDRFDAHDADGTRRIVFRRPACLPPILETDTPESWLQRLPDPPGRELIVVLQAGASAVGVFDHQRGDWLNRHVFRRYVIRGNGKAQPTHLKTKGKSRYGSRLRLQNAKKLNDETVDWIEQALMQEGPIDTVLRAAVDTTWFEFVRQCEALEPFVDRTHRIPIDVGRPNLDTLEQARRQAHRGEVLTIGDS